MKKLLYKHHLKITTLSPVHIGTSEQYEPISFVIDKGIFYKFDETIFYKSLSTEDKKAIENKMSNYLQIIEFYKTKKSEAKKISHFTCKVSKEIEGKYSAKNPNKLQIDTTFKNPNTLRAIIPGSSIKGVLDTILHIYSAPEVSSSEERQKVVVSDALLLDGGVEIGYSYRKHRYKQENGKGIPQMVEIVKPNSTFILSIDSNQNFDDIKAYAKRYYEKRGFYKENSTSFVLRIGRYCGKEYMVDSMQNLKNSYGKPLATHSLYFSDTLKSKPFGWIKLELISSEIFEQNLKIIASKEKVQLEQKIIKHASVLDILTKEKEKQKQKAEALERSKKEELEKKLAEKAEQEAKLAKMSPAERIIESYADLASLINDMKADKIENFAEIKMELATKVKAELQKNPKTWERAKQKALKRKEYIESLLNS